MRAIGKKVTVGIAAGALVLAGSGIAYAYWTTSGNGTGSAATSVGAANLSVDQTTTLTGLYPGDQPQTLAGTVTNNADNTVRVSSVAVRISSVSPRAGAEGSCDASDYAIESATMPVGVDLPAGGRTTFSGATIQFKDKGAANQDGCKGAVLELTYTVA